MYGLAGDFRFAIRSLLKTPGFTAIALVMLSCGIALNTAAFTLVNTLVKSPVPFPLPEQLFWVGGLDAENHEPTGLSFVDVERLGRSVTSFQVIGGLQPRDFSMKGEAVTGAAVTSGLIPALGLSPLHGRFFSESEYRGDGSRVIVIGERLWETRFGRDDAILGRDIELDGQSFAVVGILPRIFRSYYARYDAWTPLIPAPQERELRSLQALARTKPDANEDACRAEVQMVSERLAREYPQTNGQWRPRLSSVAGPMAHVVGGYLFLLAVVVLVLLVICANLAGLQLARAAVRQKDVVVRLALGASRWRVIRHLLFEGIVLSVISGTLGVLLTVWVRHVLIATIPHLRELVIDERALGFTLLVTIVTGLVFGLVPALTLSRADLQQALRASCPGAVASQKRARGILVVGEITVAVALLACAGLLVRSFTSLHGVNPGFDYQNLLTARVTLPEARYGEPGARVRFLREFLDRADRTTGVLASAATADLPLSGGVKTLKLRPEGEADFRAIGGRSNVVSPGYLQVLAAPLVQGRGFAESDTADSAPVALVNRKLAETLWPAGSAVGRRLDLEGQKPVMVVGVIENLNQDLTLPVFPEVLLPYSQSPRTSIQFLFRTRGETGAVIPGLKHELSQVDPALALAGLQSMEQIITGYFPPVLLIGMGAFAGITLLLSSLGLYGVVSHLVTLRSQEIGIRIALGATKSHVIRLILHDGARLIAIGTGIGLAVAVAIGRLLSSALFGVRPYDAPLFGLVALLVIAVSITAAFVPTLRATRLEPVRVLRAE
ncbi:MAG: ABC transporter permease [Acidobacteria bacterium]|nr:MAG: ABC transporter permease [Acidobacteriota bacterium]